MESWGRDESGQIIVIAALLIAVIFVGLALVLNSAIYAENLASRGDTTTAETMAVESVTEDRLGATVDAANYGTEEASYEERRARIERNVSSWDGLVAAREAESGRMYSTKLTGVTNGTRVNQSNPTRDFRPANANLLDVDPLGLGGDSNWQIAVDSDVRDFEMTVRRDSLYAADGGLRSTVSDLLEWTLDGSLVFWTQFEDGDSTHRMYLVDDTDNGSVAAVVTERDGGEEVVGVCSASAPDPSDHVTVRVTDAELEGADGTSDCPALEVVDDGSQDLYYAGSDEVEGTYRFVADREEEEFRDALHDVYESLLGLLLSDGDVYATSPTDEDPYTTTAVYEATVETAYVDDRLAYARNVSYPATAR